MAVPVHKSLPALPARPACIALITALMAGLCASSHAEDTVIFHRDGKSEHVSGKAIVTAQDGGLMLQSPDGKLWNITSTKLPKKHQDDKPFTPFSADQLKKEILKDLPPGFDTIKTAHYLIFYNTSRGLRPLVQCAVRTPLHILHHVLDAPRLQTSRTETPLVILIYADQATYARQSTDELQGIANRVIGFYSLQTNRVKTYDLTGAQSVRQPGDNKRMDSVQINELFSLPSTTTMVATVIHEATHQIAFNCGLQQRFADIPLWVSEGLAMYFETPDLSYGKGWRTIGEINPPRLERFQSYLLRRPADSLETLIVDDKRFRGRDAQTALDAYAEAWALNYFLLRMHSKGIRVVS